jgi:2-polyprenyl-3-methyl-5-hydroxy-6-metoxy-1,4-benzoquinol methylase
MRESARNDNERQLKYTDGNFITRYANGLFFKAITEILSNLSFSSVLDAGCGEGVPLSLARQSSPASRLVGFDLDKRRVEICAKVVESVFVANAHHIPAADRSFDIVLCLETLEHVGEPFIAVAEIARVTKRYALFSVPNEPWWRLGNMARFKYIKDFGNTPGHINHWTAGGFKKMISPKFKLLRSVQPFLWTFVLAEKLT